MVLALTPTESLLVFSDVHLGNDLNDAGPRVRRSESIDRDLACLLAHWRGVTPRADRWRLVLAGDFIDFVGMSVDPAEDEPLETELTPEERRNGVGSAEDHARLKLRRVAARHPEIFAELAAFVAAGNALTVLHGNHDIELYWDRLKTDFRELVVAGIPDAGERERARARIDFEPWFFYREGVVYIEHGHQYDPFCSTEFILAPLSPRDPRRVERGYSEQLLRAIVRRTPGLREHGHENLGIGDYVAMGTRLGLRGLIGLLARFLATTAELTLNQRAYASPEARALRVAHEHRLEQRGARTKLGIDRLRNLRALQSRPAGVTFRGVLGGVMLDRLLLGATTAFALATLAVVARRSRFADHTVVMAAFVVVGWITTHIALSQGRAAVDPGRQMVTRAAQIAKLFSTPYVVMGHTHVPLIARAGEAMYVNVGSWSEEEIERVTSSDIRGGHRAARTHLVIHPGVDARPEALFYEWHAGEGPRLVARV